MQAPTVLCCTYHFCSHHQKRTLLFMDAGPCSRSGRMGARGVVVVVTDNILTPSKVQSLCLLQLKRMHFNALAVVSGGRISCSSSLLSSFFSRTLAPVSVLCKERLKAGLALASLVLSCHVFSLYIYIHHLHCNRQWPCTCCCCRFSNISHLTHF